MFGNLLRNASSAGHLWIGCTEQQEKEEGTPRETITRNTLLSTSKESVHSEMCSKERRMPTVGISDLYDVERYLLSFKKQKSLTVIFRLSKDQD